MAKLILPVGEPDPYVRVASAMRQEGAQRLAYPVGEARCFPVHGFRDAEALNGLKDRCASGAALYKADPALADINTHNRALFAEQRTEGRGRRNLEGWGERSGSVVFLGCTADMIQQLLDENQAAIQAAQDALTAAQNKLEEIEQENKKAENDCSNLFTWASTYQNASFQQRQAILNQFIKEVRVGRDYDIEIILNVPLEEFEEFKSHSLSVRTLSGRKTDLKQAPVRGLGTPNGGNRRF